ncbi:hypothetical protein BGZ83_001185, partial [Gryganskiella cystojenkinii]
MTLLENNLHELRASIEKVSKHSQMMTETTNLIEALALGVQQLREAMEKELDNIR